MTQQPPNLEAISEQRPDSGLERRRVPRLGVSGEQFRLGLNGKIFSVVDLSLDGMALRIIDREDLAVFPVGMKVDGILNLNREKYPVQARVRRLGGDVIGFQFENLTDPLASTLRDFLDPEVLGRELRPIPSPDQGTQGTLWYHGPSGTDLLLFRALSGEFWRFTLYILGMYVQWDEEQGLFTGRAEPSQQPDEVRGVIRFETMLLRPDSAPDASKLAVARALISSSSLPADLRRLCLRKLGS